MTITEHRSATSALNDSEWPELGQSTVVPVVDDRNPWTPAVYTTAALAGADGLAAVWALWAGHDLLWRWAVAGGLLLTVVALLALAEEHRHAA